ncbi:hypothetical protein ACFX13_006664 [Malus domestica]
MKKNFVVKIWPPDLVLEEVDMKTVEDPAKARGFLRVRVLVNSENPFVLGCWLKIEVNRETWVEFRAEGYGDWLKAPPVRDFVEPVRPTRLEVGEQRKVRMVRDSDRPESRLQSPIHSEAPSGKEKNEANAGAHSSQTRDKKKWHRLQRQQSPSRQIQVVVPQLSRQLRWEFPASF